MERVDHGNLCKVDHSSTITNLLQFLKANKWQNIENLQVIDFPETGRGIRTIRGRDFEAGETLIDMPFGSIFISLITLMADKHFHLNCLTRLEGTISTQLALSVYVLYQKHLGEKSKWTAYIDSLPAALSTPHFCHPTELECIPMIRGLVAKTTQSLFNSFDSAFANSICECCGNKLVNLITHEDLLLMFYLVNSRSVYCDPRVIRNNCNGNDLTFLSDEPNMALAPFLDLFNHSDCVETESLLYLDRKSSELRYQLDTKTPLKANEQLFISYGNHCNFKLLTEYGFLIKDNRHEKIDLSLDQIGDFMRSYPKFYHAKKMAFIQGQEMGAELFISSDGLSYNLETILKIFKSAGLTEKSLSELIYNQSTLPVDESVDLERALYLYLIARFERARKALDGVQEPLTNSGKLLREFFALRIEFLEELMAQSKGRE